MNIPKSITIGGVDIAIEKDTTLMNTRGLVGLSSYELQKITIDPTVEGQDIYNQTFIHEVVHFILYVMGQQKLRKNEKFVDGFAHLAYQIIKDITK